MSAGLQTDDMMNLLFGNWPPIVADTIEKELLAVVAQSTNQTLTLGALLTVFFASNGVEAVRRAIEKSYREVDDRAFWRKRLTCVIFVLIGAVLLVGVAILLVAVPIYLAYFADIVPILQLEFLGNRFLRLALASAPLIFAVFACHSRLTGSGRSFASVWPGVAFTIVLWVAFAKGFTFYIGNFSNYSVTYAGLAGVMSALMFLYLIAAILILGAAFNEALLELKKSEDPA
jgi:membrane protein